MKYIFALLFILGLTASAHAAPSCAQLNKTWVKAHLLFFEIIGWDEKSFSCPSEKANVSTSLYYLENIKIIGDDGREIFDYYAYVLEEIKTLVKSTGIASYVNNGYMYIGTGLTATHGPNGNLLRSVGVEGAEAFVHERKHMDRRNVKHVYCKEGDKDKHCAAQFHSLRGYQNRRSDLYVDAYSVSVDYLTDIVLHGQGSDFSKTAARNLIRQILDESFISITKKQRADALLLVGAE